MSHSSKWYTIEDRQLIAETADLRVQILTVAEGQEIPWHHHSAVTDSFTCLEGPMVVRTRGPVRIANCSPATATPCRR